MVSGTHPVITVFQQPLQQPSFACCPSGASITWLQCMAMQHNMASRLPLLLSPIKNSLLLTCREESDGKINTNLIEQKMRSFTTKVGARSLLGCFLGVREASFFETQSYAMLAAAIVLRHMHPRRQLLTTGICHLLTLDCAGPHSRHNCGVQARH